MNRYKNYIVEIITIIILILIDLWTKTLAVSKLIESDVVLIPGVLEFHYLENIGAAFSMLSGKMIVFYIITPVFLAVITYIMIKMPGEKLYFPIRTCLIFLVAGALGNFYDRVVLHYVRDFIYFSLIDFPVFNVADIYVTVSIFFLIILILFKYKDEDFSFFTASSLSETDSRIFLDSSSVFLKIFSAFFLASASISLSNISVERNSSIIF